MSYEIVGLILLGVFAISAVILAMAERRERKQWETLREQMLKHIEELEKKEKENE